MTLTEKSAYVRGLIEGLELDENSKEVKVIKAMADMLDDMALTISDLEEGYNDLCDQLDAVDEDLNTLENDFYEEDDDEDEDEEFYEVTCPSCNETVCLSEDIPIAGEFKCPNCGENLELDLENCCDEGCGCGCDHHEDN